MIIQCEQCNAKFRLDDSRVTDKGVKVRCAKCKHVFTVKKEAPEIDPQPDFASMLDDSVTCGQQQEADFQPQPQETSPPVSEPFSGSFLPPQDDTSERTVVMTAQSFNIQKDDSQPTGIENDPFSLSSLEGDKGFTMDNEQSTSSASGFGDFDFGDVSADADRTIVATSPVSPVTDIGDRTMIQSPVAAQPTPTASADFDFGGDDALFGEAVAPPPEEEPGAPISFDFQMEDFADSMGATEKNTGSTKIDLPTGEASGESPFSMEEIDFGDEFSSVAVQQVNPDELKPAQHILFAPLAEAQEKPVVIGEDTLKKTPPAEFLAKVDEPPPLSIASRRKQSPLMTGIFAVLGVAVLALVGFFGYSYFSGSSTKTNAVATENIIIKSAVTASFVKNKEAGELLLINGEAVNSFKKPRAAIQVKGLVYGAGGQVLASKVAYCGNQITSEQAATMPLVKIEAAMANQFGDSLSNLEIAPGKAIPFTIIIAKPPPDARDFGVEPAGSTIATGKTAQ